MVWISNHKHKIEEKNQQKVPGPPPKLSASNWWTCVNFQHWVFCYYFIELHNLAFNSLRPSDAIWRQWFWTTLAQVMACCLTAPSHYLNQCWLIIRGVLWHTSESSFAGIAQGIDSGYEFEKDILKNIFKSPRGQWVKLPVHKLCRCYSFIYSMYR